MLISSRHPVRVLFLGRSKGGERLEVAPAVAQACEAAGLDPPRRVLTTRQRHTGLVVDVDRSDFPESGTQEATEEVTEEVADGLITGRPGTAVAVYTADCVPVLLAAEGAVAAVHAGWRGLVASIVATGTRTLAERVGCSTSSLTAWVGPCMSGCCYQVGDDVAHEVAMASSPEVVVAATTRSRKQRLDLAAAAVVQLRRAGVEDVRRLRHCTGCAPDVWWSHRREGGGAGRNYAVIWRPDDGKPRGSRAKARS